MLATSNRKIIILTAPSGAGKTTLAHALLKRMPELAFSVSATTRKPRSGEQDGKDYYFLSEQEFKRRIDADAFVEFEMVYEGLYYGTLKSELERIWASGAFPLRVVDVVGAESLKQRFGDLALTVFIEPPSLETLKERLHGRGTESQDKLNERLAKAKLEIQNRNRFDFVVLNDSLDHAIESAQTRILSFLGS